MMEPTFAPLIAMLVVWSFVSIVLRTVKKAGKGTGNPAAKGPAAQGSPDKGAGKAVAAKDAKREGTSSPPDESAAQPAGPRLTVTRPDASFYEGSLHAVTGEGEDPCHEEQFSLLNEAESGPDIGSLSPEAARPGLSLSFGGADVVRGIVMSEILKRPRR